MEILDNKALVLRVRDPARFSVLPRKHVTAIDGGYQVLVPWKLDEVRVLRNLGINAPSPITGKYHWPGKYKPMAHQMETAAFSTLNRRHFIFSDPGTAKTMSALWAADYLMSIGEVRRCLVICPLSIMATAWIGDINKSIIHRSAVIAHHAQAAKRIELIQGDYEFVIINYDGLPLVAEEIKRDGRFDLVIVDEASALSNAQTRRWKSVQKILTPSTLLWLMTGTPAAQSPLQAYGLAKLVNPTAVPGYFSAWRDKVMYRLTIFKWMPKPGANELVFNVLQPAIRFTKEQCLDLPPVLTETREVALTPQQMKYYNLIKTQMIAQASGETITAVNKAAVVSKLLQISAAAVLTDTKEVVEFDATPRLNVLLEVLEETQRKVIIFALFRASIAVIMEFLKKNGIACEEIHGGVPAGRRGGIINRFQNTPHPRVLVMQPQATAHGITLTAADTVVFFGPVMSVELYVQAISRADRKGQDAAKVTVVHIQGSPIEKKLFDAMSRKEADHELLTALFDSEIEGD
jgi:SNF2 family DNA or RNA helicase